MVKDFFGNDTLKSKVREYIVYLLLDNDVVHRKTTVEIFSSSELMSDANAGVYGKKLLEGSPECVKKAVIINGERVVYEANR